MTDLKKGVNKLELTDKEEAALKKKHTGPTVSSAKTTEELLEAEKNLDPMMAPSGMFGLYLPKFIQLINGMSRKHLIRLMQALVAYPLEDLHPNKNSEAEVMAYNMGDRLLQSKYIMIIHTAMEHEQARAVMEACEMSYEEASDMVKVGLNVSNITNLNVEAFSKAVNKTEEEVQVIKDKVTEFLNTQTQPKGDSDVKK